MAEGMRISVWLPQCQIEALKRNHEKKGIGQSEMIRRLIDEWIKQTPTHRCGACGSVALQFFAAHGDVFQKCMTCAHETRL